MELFDPYWPGGLGDGITRARALQDAGSECHDWCVLCDCLADETSECRHKKILDEYLDHLLTSAEERKKKLRMQILPALRELQQFLPSLWLERETLAAPASKVLGMPAMIVARGRDTKRRTAVERRRRFIGSLPQA